MKKNIILFIIITVFFSASLANAAVRYIGIEKNHPTFQKEIEDFMLGKKAEVLDVKSERFEINNKTFLAAYLSIRDNGYLSRIKTHSAEDTILMVCDMGTYGAVSNCRKAYIGSLTGTPSITYDSNNSIITFTLLPLNKDYDDVYYIKFIYTNGDFYLNHFSDTNTKPSAAKKSKMSETTVFNLYPQRFSSVKDFIATYPSFKELFNKKLGYSEEGNLVEFTSQSFNMNGKDFLAVMMASKDESSDSAWCDPHDAFIMICDKNPNGSLSNCNRVDLQYGGGCYINIFQNGDFVTFDLDTDNRFGNTIYHYIFKNINGDFYLHKFYNELDGSNTFHILYEVEPGGEYTIKMDSLDDSQLDKWDTSNDFSRNINYTYGKDLSIFHPSVLTIINDFKKGIVNQSEYDEDQIFYMTSRSFNIDGKSYLAMYLARKDGVISPTAMICNQKSDGSVSDCVKESIDSYGFKVRIDSKNSKITFYFTPHDDDEISLVGFDKMIFQYEKGTFKYIY